MRRDSSGDFPQQAGLAVEGVEQLEMVARLEQQARVVLAVDLHQVLAQPPEEGAGDQLAADGAAPGAGRRDLPPDQQAVRRIDAVQPLLPQDGPHRAVGGHLEQALHRRLGLPGPDQLGRGARPRQQAHRVDDDGLARAGFAGDDVQAGPELDFQVLDDGDVADVQET